MELFNVQNIMTLGMLILLQAVLGFDNLLYISIESKRVAVEQQSAVRRLGIGLAIILRIALLFVVVSAIKYFQDPIWSLDVPQWVTFQFSVHSLIVMAGGVFIIYTAVKEIYHMLSDEHLVDGSGNEERSVLVAVTRIVIMNLVFSFDSILSAIALTDVFWVMATAIVISGVLMVWLADRVADFLKRNRIYEVLGLFILFLVGVMLVSEGAHLAHLNLFQHEIHAMQKSTFYFVIFVLVIVDVVQSRYQKKLLSSRKAALSESST